MKKWNFNIISMAGIFLIKVYKWILLFLTGVIIVLTTSCVNDEIVSIPEPYGPDKSGYMKIHLNMPDLRTPAAKVYGSRAMNDYAERAIDPKLLNILVFDYNDDGNGNITETFCYMAPVSESIVYDELDKNKATVTVRLTKNISPGDLYRIMVIANHDLSGINLTTKEDITKEGVLEQLTYTVQGKWNADSNSYSPFPMWGENAPTAIFNDMPSPTINLYRALARIDIGLNFAIDNGKLTEQAHGISDFKLKEILVFRTYNKGHIASLSDNFTNTPSIPSDASRHADNSPLSYIIQDEGGASSYVREIYVPEADLPSSPENDNIHCIVVGGYYKNSPVMSYYRLDFAEETNLGVRTYLPILRNHRYILNIIQVCGPGFLSAQSALSSHGTIENIDYNLIVWNESIHEMATQGKYYFGLDNRNLLVGAKSTNNDLNNTHTISYQTNYPLSTSDPLELSWASVLNDPTFTPLFNAQWQAISKSIVITVRNDNTTKGLLSDTLFVQAGPFTMKIFVQQEYIDVKYSLDCTSITVNGAYKRGITLEPSEHYFTISIIANSRDMQGYPYVIETVDPYDHGIYFRAEGNFDFTGIQEGDPLRIDNIRMEGSGTLQATENENTFSLPIVSNSPSGSSCEATIQLVIPHMNILIMGMLDSQYGYSISDISRGAGKVFNSPNNFGPKDNSIIKVEGFTFITHETKSNGSNSDFSTSTTSDAYKWVTGIGNSEKIADIVYIVSYMKFDAKTSKLLVDYLDKGGVIVAFNEDNSTQYLINALLGVTTSPYQYGRSGSIYPFPAHPYFHSNENDMQETLRRFEGDFILNGPFGDVRDKQWGEDMNTTLNIGVGNLPMGDTNLTIYSYLVNIAPASPIKNMNYVNGLKYESEERNIVWFGDGGFMAGGREGEPHVGGTSSPLYWNLDTFFPEPKPVYGHDNSYMKPVYNSTTFCNIMAWAIQKSDSLRAKRNNY